MSTTKTKVATFTLPIVVLDFADGEFGYEIGVNGALNFDSGFKSFDEAEGAARKAAEFLEKRMLAEYTDAASTIATESLTPGSIKALVEALDDLLLAVFDDDKHTAREAAKKALAPFKGAQEVRPDE